jgi:uncharacterized protein (DUF2384 family)
MYDNKSNPKNITYSHAYSKALEVFQYDKDKTNSWWISKHNEFDGKSPYELVKEGNGRKLMKIMDRCLL